MTTSGTRIAFLGGGKMASALIHSLLRKNVCAPEHVFVSEPNEPARAELAPLGVQLANGNVEAVQSAEVVILAVKPWVVAGVLAEIAPVLKPEQLVISIAAGISLAAMERLLPAGIPLLRVMPNLCLQVGEGASAICGGAHATAAHVEQGRALFAAGGQCVAVTEAQMDAVTGLSGSGPAYVCLLIEALADGGVRAGLPRDAAQLLAAQTLYGTAKLILESGEHPAVWKDRVATPGGTTIAGLARLEQSAVRGAMIDAVTAAAERSRELGRG